MKKTFSKIKNLIERIRNSNQQQTTSETYEAVNGSTVRSLSNDDLSVTNRKRNFYMSRPIKNPKTKTVFKKAKVRFKGYKLWSNINQEVKNLGTNSNLFDAHEAYRLNLDQIMENKKRKVVNLSDLRDAKLGCLFHPDSKCKSYWYFLVLVAVLYVIVGMPIVLAFAEVVPGSGIFLFETFIDFLFFIDILVTFNSAFINSSGQLEISRWKIVKNYLTGFFLLDFLAIFPFWYVTDVQSSQTTHLTRMIRLTKLTRIFRISKVVPIIRSMFDSKSMSSLLDFFMNYQGATRLLTIIYSIMIIVHYISCIWYFMARLDGIYPDTWVARMKFDQDDDEVLYLRGVYFAFTVMNTVGFGDIKPYRTEEIALCIVIMMFGICFYSFLVATLTSILSSIDVNTARLNSKRDILDELQSKYKISSTLKKKIFAFIKQNKYGDINSFTETINKLPKKLQYYLVFSMHKSAPQNINFLKGCEDQFSIDLIPKLALKSYQPGKFVYEKGSLPFELYMISTGRISYIFGSNNLEIKTFPAGSYFGDVELFKYIPRKFSATTTMFSEVFTVSNKVFLEILEKFPKISKEFQRKVEVQDHYDNENLNEILDLLEITEVSKTHTLEELEGQSRIFNKKPRNRPKLSTVFFRKTLTTNRHLNENNSKIHILMELQEIRVEIENLAEIINKISANSF